MKKIWILALAAGLAAGPAEPLAAASQIDFSGYYRVMYMSETNNGHVRENASFTDAYFQDRLQLDLAFRPTDEISVHWRLRSPDTYRRWGSRDQGDRSLHTRHVYGRIEQSWGTVLVGSISDDLDCGGLCTLGYQPVNIPIYTKVGPFDRAEVLDAIRYQHQWANGFSLMVQYGKLGYDEVDPEPPGTRANASPYGASDRDSDLYQLEAAYHWDGGGVSLLGSYNRNAMHPGLFPYQYYGWGPATQRLIRTEQWSVNPAFRQSWGNFSLNFEGLATWGQARYIQRRNSETGKHYINVDGEGYGAYLDLGYNYGPGNVTLAGWGVAGTDLNENPALWGSKSNSLANLVGGGFYPLLVAYNGLNSNPAGSRYQGQKGANLSAVSLANNAYLNYVYGGHVGAIQDRTDYRQNYQRDTVGYMSLNGIELSPGSVVNVWGNDLMIIQGGPFIDQVLALPMSMGTREFSNQNRTNSFNNDTDANHWALALTGNHAFSEDISLHYGLAYLALFEPNYKVATGATFGNNGRYNDLNYDTQEKDLGYEIDLGLTVKLLDHLEFTTAFGYMFNGDAYKSLKGYKVTNRNADSGGTVRPGDNIQAVWQDADDSYVWFNSLTFAF